MELIRKKVLLLFFIFILSSCQSVKEGLSLQKKKQNVDEFLIEKKNPLVVPPDYSDLPEPKKQSGKKPKEENLDLSQVLGESTKSKETNSSDKLEKSISDLLNKK